MRFRFLPVVVSVLLVLGGIHPLVSGLDLREGSTTPALRLAYTTSLWLEWWDQGSGGTYNGAYFAPIVPAGYYALGHYGQSNYGPPIGGMWVVQELEAGALARPIDYVQVWGDYGSGADLDGSFWYPVPPVGYVSLGLVAQTGYGKPGLDEVRCVRQDLTRPGAIGPMVWIDAGTGASIDFGSWHIVPADPAGLYSGTFAGHNSHIPPTFGVFVLDSARIEKETPATALELAFVDEYELVWWDKGSGGDYDGAYYRPVAPQGFFALGHYGQGDYAPPRGTMFAARALEAGALAPPADYVLIWADHGSGADLDGSFWKPIPPAGYVCLGSVAQRGYNKPSLDEIRCVRKDLACPARLHTKQGKNTSIWIDQGTGASTDFGSWRIVPTQDQAVYMDTFGGYRSHSPPPDIVFGLDARAVSAVEDPLDAAEVDGLIRQYGPRLVFHPDETYWMDDPEWVLDHGVQLGWALVENEWNYDTHTEAHPGAMSTTHPSLTGDAEYVLDHVKPNPPYNDAGSFRLWLTISDASKPGNQDRAKAFVRVLPWNTFFTELQFWFFYPFNGPGRVEICLSGQLCGYYQMTEPGRHYGDWEHVTLRFLNSSQELVSVYMSAHDGGHRLGEHEFGSGLGFEGSHPVIYVAKYSHAHYPSLGYHDYQRVYEVDYIVGTFSVDLYDRTGAGEHFDTSLPGNYSTFSSGVFPVRGPDWLKFSGRWGQYEKLSQSFDYLVYEYDYKDVGAGPTGPAMKAAWNRGDVADEYGWPSAPLGQEWMFLFMPVVVGSP